MSRKPPRVCDPEGTELAGGQEPAHPAGGRLPHRLYLDLSEAQANFLLGQCTGYGLHYRDPKDAVYAWFLRNDRGYDQARTFYRSLAAPSRLTAYQESAVHLTRELQSTFSSVRDVESLRRAYLDRMDQFGQLHLRDYHCFEKYLGHLTHPDTGWGGAGEPDYSLETMMERYLSLRTPSGRSRNGYSVVQKLLKRNWPNATALKNIRAHRETAPVVTVTSLTWAL